VAGIFSITEKVPQKFAVITHAGGSAVLLTDALEKSGLTIPDLSNNPEVNTLKTYLHEGSSANNPIDFLATGTADQLGIIIDFCEHKFDEIDGIIVIFGSPGLFNVKNVYNVLDVKMSVGKKPIFPVLPSIVNAGKEIKEFIAKGRINFMDEVELGRALGAIKNTPAIDDDLNISDLVSKRHLIEIKKILSLQKKEILNPITNQKILNLIGIKTVKEEIVNSAAKLNEVLSHFNFPVVMKVVGPVHKTEVGGVSLNINSQEAAKWEFKRLMDIQGAEGVLIQEMVSGTELYIGAKNEPGYGNLIMCGLGGIYLEIIKDIASEFTPISPKKAKEMIRTLKIHPIFEGVRNMPPLDIDAFADIIVRLGILMDAFKEIKEIDLNPVIAHGNLFTCVDARILIQPEKTPNIVDKKIMS
jgi:acetyltransferase